MPEFRANSPPFDYTSKIMSEVGEIDLCKSLGLSDISIPKLQYNPLPLQCLAAEALPSNVKDEIEQLTKSSLMEVRSNTADSKRSSSSLEMSTRESDVSVPLQFFTNGMGLRLVGGVSCPHSGEIHAQIINLSKQNERDVQQPEQVASLLGLCVLEFEGQSLKGVSFESVRKLTRTTKNTLVKLRMKDCRCLSVSSQSREPTKPSSTNSGNSLETKERPRLLTMQRYRKFKRRVSMESLYTPADSSTGVLSSPVKSNLGLGEHQSQSGTVISAVGSPINNTTKDKPMVKKTSTVSLDSSISNKNKVESGTLKKRKNNNVKAGNHGIQEGSGTGAALENKLYVNMPKGMIQLSLKYVNSQKTLYISLFKVKWQSVVIGAENTGIFYNTYIFPNKRGQSGKYGKIISSTLTTDLLHSRSISYILTEEEVNNTSIRIIIWEQSGQTFSSKKHLFKGEVFLALNDRSVVNLQGVPEWYTICQPDPNLPAVPKAFQNTGTLMRKMMDSANQTFEVMTLKRKKKSVSPSTGGVIKADSLMDISDGQETVAQSTLKISKLLEPLKDNTKKSEAPQFCNLMLRPATVGTMPSASNGMSLYEFLIALDPEMDVAMKSQSLPMKSPLFSSCENLKQGEEDEELNDEFNSKRRPSVFSDGTNTVSNPVRRERGSLFRFLESLDCSPSKISNAESHDSIQSLGSDLSSSLSSISIDRSRDGGHFQGWSENGSYKSDHNDTNSDISSLHSSGSRKSKQTTHSLIVSSKPPPQDLSDVIGHGSTQNSLVISNQISPGDQSPSPTEICKQVPVIQVSPDFTEEALEGSNNTFTISPDGTNGSTPDTVKALSPNSEANHSEFSPLKTITRAPLNSTPKKKSPLRVQLSKSMGNISDELHFVEDDTDGSFGDLDEMGASCLDSFSPRRMPSNAYSASQDDLYSFLNFSASQREALECSTNSSSLDFSSFSQPSPVAKTSFTRNSSDHLGVLIEESGEHHLESSSHHATKKPHEKSDLSPRDNKLSPQQRHKWISMDSGLNPKKDDDNMKQLAKLRAKQPKNASPSVVKKLSHLYKIGKVYGSVQLKISAMCVTSQISVEILDIVFFNQKLMNADFEVRASLYNRMNDHCQDCQKGHLSLRKNRMAEKKDFPSPFHFTGNPTLFYLQVLFQMTNRVFSKKYYHIWIDIKETMAESYEKTLWLQLNKL